MLPEAQWQAYGAQFMRGFERSLRLVDFWRRFQGSWLDAAGHGPERTPSRLVFAHGGLRLHAFGSESAPPLLLVPAPIKQAYIWDLSPATSVVRRACEAGWNVHLVEWPRPGQSEAGWGIEDYACRMLGRCVEALGERPGIIGHSLGGTLAGLFAARYPERVGALALIEGPLAFGERGAFGPLLGAGRDGAHRWPAMSVVPGAFLNLVSLSAAPDTFIADRYRDFLASLGEREALATHLRVQRWTLDEMPMPGRLLDELVRDLYRGDRFMQGTLTLDGECVAPSRITMPLYCIGERASRVVPAAAVAALVDAVGSGNKRVAWYGGDRGVALQHIGPLVGRSAHARLWPALFDWLRRAEQQRRRAT